MKQKTFNHSHFPSLGKRIVVYLVLILGPCGGLFFLWMARQQEAFVIKQLRHQALGIYHYIVLAREWISSHGGIYLREGDKYRLITPSIFTREIALFARKRQPYAVKIAALDSKNPEHQPDEFESSAIKMMQSGQKRELWKLVNVKKKILFRYAAPLIFENDCAKCHQNLPKYNICGCISISFPATSLFKEVARNKNYYFIYLFASLGIVLMLLIILLKRAVSDLSLAYDDLRRMEKFKSDFFSNITHDLKTPITAIKGASDILAKKLRDEEYGPYIEILKRNVTRLSSMVRDLLDCARLESGELELNKEQLDLAEVVEDAVLMVQPLAWENQIEIEYDPLEEPYYVVADRGRIEQAVSNLLTNAIKFSDKGSKVIVSLAYKGDQVVMSVEDFGPGIPQGEQDMVFKKFYRRSREKKSDGLGLGLAIARGVVEAHGGKIWISQPDHQGVIMNISLPVAKNA